MRPAKSLRQTSGKKPGGQQGHRGHYLRQGEIPDEVIIYPVVCCEHCQYDLRVQRADLPEKRLWVTEHRVEEKQCPQCFHLTRASFPATVSAPAQYGAGIQTLATYLVEGQTVPYARASNSYKRFWGFSFRQAVSPPLSPPVTGSERRWNLS